MSMPNSQLTFSDIEIISQDFYDHLLLILSVEPPHRAITLLEDLKQFLSNWRPRALRQIA